jgi:type II secretory pathway pseudopilin PulG
MNKKTKILFEGFTLTETLVNIIIISSITFSMMFVFIQIQNDFNKEGNKADMISYGNNILDDLEFELSQSEKLITTNQTANNTSLELHYPNSEQPKTKYLISKDRGLFKNNRALDIFNPIDEQNRLKYRISDFNIRQPSLTQGDIWSYEANSARFSSYEIILEIDLYNTNEEIIETLQFKRRVFSPAKYIYNKRINNV